MSIKVIYTAEAVLKEVNKLKVELNEVKTSVLEIQKLLEQLQKNPRSKPTEK
ncbi:hypothetical protein Nos7524_3183 [Nostoc sp. PCC 7524]|nr:hypothetical protein Nos7524_3183 [Nostoc sp. PCC 7524]